MERIGVCLGARETPLLREENRTEQKSQEVRFIRTSETSELIVPKVDNAVKMKRGWRFLGQKTLLSFNLSLYYKLPFYIQLR